MRLRSCELYLAIIISEKKQWIALKDLIVQKNLQMNKKVVLFPSDLMGITQSNQLLEWLTLRSVIGFFVIYVSIWGISNMSLDR